jgi:hypothetical protein
MQTLFIGFVNDTVDYAMKGIAIRIAYLLSARFRLAGNIPDYYTLNQSLHFLSFERKMKMIDEYMKYEPDRELVYDRYRDFEKQRKKHNLSHKEYIVAKKKLEKNILSMFSIIVNNIADTIQKAGITDLKPIEDTSAYGEYMISYTNPEREVDNCSILSDLLTLNLDEKDNEHPTVFVLTDLFFSSEFDPGDDEMPVLNNFSNKGFLQELNTCPDYNVLSVPDLNTLRFEMTEGIENFQVAINTFTALHANPPEAFNYLQNNVVAAAKNLAAGINKTPLINNYRNHAANNSDIGSILLGMIPQSLVFKYFEFIKVSLQDTIEIIRQIPEAESRKLVAVLIVTLRTETAGEETKMQQMPLRKTLSID